MESYHRLILDLLRARAVDYVMSSMGRANLLWKPRVNRILTRKVRSDTARVNARPVVGHARGERSGENTMRRFS